MLLTVTAGDSLRVTVSVSTAGRLAAYCFLSDTMYVGSDVALA